MKSLAVRFNEAVFVASIGITLVILTLTAPFAALLFAKVVLEGLFK